MNASRGRIEAFSGIDHLLIAVHNLERAATTYRRLGFTLSPRGQHSAPMGTANHTIMLSEDYFELLAVLATTPANERWRMALSRGEGLAGFAAATPSATAARAAWQQAGMTPGEVLTFSRPVEHAGGTKTEARFEVVTLPSETQLGMSIFACAHLTRGAVWLPELLHHANTARAIRGLTLASPHPQKTAAHWEKVLPGSIVLVQAGGVQLTIGNHIVEILDREAAVGRFGYPVPIDEARPLAIQFAVADVAACRSALTAAGVAMRQDGDLTRVADTACGTIIEFVRAREPIA